jgi:hypothetical protein
MVLGDVEETHTVVEIDEETSEEIIKVRIKTSVLLYICSCSLFVCSRTRTRTRTRTKNVDSLVVIACETKDGNIVCQR